MPYDLDNITVAQAAYDAIMTAFNCIYDMHITDEGIVEVHRALRLLRSLGAK